MLFFLGPLFASLHDFRLRIFEGRSPQWRGVRERHLEKEPVCQVCGGKKRLNVHHIKPFHLFPNLELDPANLITLCEKSKIDGINCHFLFGHLGDWQAWNPSVRRDAAAWASKILLRRYS